MALCNLLLLLALPLLVFLFFQIRSRLLREIKSLRRQLDRSQFQTRQLHDRSTGFNPLLNILALETDTSGIIEFITGWPQRSILVGAHGGALSSFLSGEQESILQDVIAAVLAGSTVEDQEFHFRLENGGSLPVCLTAAPRYHEGRVNGLRAVLKDISGEIKSRRVLDRKTVMEFTTSNILRSFVRVSAGNLEDTMGEALASLEKLTTVDRCHLVLLGSDQESLQWEYQWCAPGIKQVPPENLPTSLSSVPWFQDKVGQNEILHLKSLSDLPDQELQARKILAKAGVKSMLAFSLYRQGEILGFLLISSVRETCNWDSDGIRVLKILADVLGAAVQRRDAELALQAANRQLKDIISFLPDPTFVIDSGKKVVAWNRAMEELTGVPEQEMVGRGDYSYAVPFYGEPVPVLIDHFGDADLSRWRKLYNFVEINGDTLYAESFVPFLNDGQGAYLWLTASPLYDSEGNVAGAIESLRDVTYRKKSQEALRVSEHRFRQLIETMNDGLAIFDTEGLINFTNPSLCSLLGFTMEEVLESRVEELFPQMVMGHSLEQWPGWQLGCNEAVEMEVICKDGRKLPLRLSPAHICDSQGHFAGGMAIVSDMTPMRQAEDRIRILNQELEQKVIDGTHELLATNRALTQSEERFRRIIESLREGYIFYSQDPQGNFSYVSPSFREILGFRKLDEFAEELRVWMVDPRNHLARINSEKSRLGYRQTACDLHIEHRDGTAMILEVQENPVFDGQGQIISVEGLCRDVTENRRNLRLIQEAREQLVESEKLVALGSMVAGLSHEINTPVGIGVTAASHLVQEAEICHRSYQDHRLTRVNFESFLESAQESAGLIQTNLNRAADLLQNFKLVATDQTAGQERTFNLNEYLDDVVQSLSPKFRNTGFKLSSKCPENLEMHCDPGALYQVLSNLVMNSLLHGFEGLLVGEIDILAYQKGNEIVLEYRDSGNGMTRKDLARLYEPFFTTKRGRGGTGLGMHIVYNNVTQTLGGSISCASKPGRGTRFTISVPLPAEVEHG